MRFAQRVRLIGAENPGRLDDLYKALADAFTRGQNVR